MAIDSAHLTPWSAEEIERVMRSDISVFQDAVAYYGSEAALLFAAENVALNALIVRPVQPFRTIRRVTHLEIFAAYD